MRTVFADTFYWIALTNPKDEWHATVVQISRGLEPVQMVTTDEVLTELLTWYSGHGPNHRTRAAQIVHTVMKNPNIRTLPQTRVSFERGLRFYESRNDKAYSLTDCISMEAMRDEGLHEILTNDHHFEQESFTILIKQKS
jgi:predicted nucleic acid-binding protein